MNMILRRFPLRPLRSFTPVGLLLFGAALSAPLFPRAAAADPVFNLAFRPDTREVDVEYKGRKLLTYVLRPSPFKPYVRELYSLNGINVLLDAPSDHLHHHGLMYAVTVNGTNFWEETPKAGYQVSGPDVDRRVFKRPDGLPAAELSQELRWVSQKDAPADAALLIERRTLAVTVDEPAGEVAVQWKSDFQVGPGADNVTLSGSAYQGLGLRFPPPFDHTGRRANSEGAAYTAEATWDVTPARWASMAQTINGKDVTVTVFDDPANAAEPRFFSMLNHFAYISATQGLDEKPLVYARGDRFSLRYLVTVHAANRTSTELNHRFERWLKP